jgi:hypothetical protein
MGKAILALPLRERALHERGKLVRVEVVSGLERLVHLVPAC